MARTHKGENFHAQRRDDDGRMLQAAEPQIQEEDGWDQGRSLHGPQGGGKIGRDGAVPRKLEKTCYGNQQESRSGQEGSRPVARKAQFPLLYGNVADIVHPQAGFHRTGKCVG